MEEEVQRWRTLRDHLAQRAHCIDEKTEASQVSVTLSESLFRLFLLSSSFLICIEPLLCAELDKCVQPSFTDEGAEAPGRWACRSSSYTELITVGFQSTLLSPTSGLSLSVPSSFSELPPGSGPHSASGSARFLWVKEEGAGHTFTQFLAS